VKGVEIGCSAGVIWNCIPGFGCQITIGIKEIKESLLLWYIRNTEIFLLLLRETTFRGILTL